MKLLNKHEESEWHLASAEAWAMDESARMQERGIMEQIVAATGEEKRKNRELIRQLIRSVFLVRNRIPHTTTVESLIAL